MNISVLLTFNCKHFTAMDFIIMIHECSIVHDFSITRSPSGSSGSAPSSPYPGSSSCFACDVIVISIGGKIQMYGFPDGGHTAPAVGGLGHDAGGRTSSEPALWGSWDPNGQCPPTKLLIQGLTGKRLRPLSPIQ